MLCLLTMLCQLLLHLIEPLHLDLNVPEALMFCQLRLVDFGFGPPSLRILFEKIVRIALNDYGKKKKDEVGWLIWLTCPMTCQKSKSKDAYLKLPWKRHNTALSLGPSGLCPSLAS